MCRLIDSHLLSRINVWRYKNPPVKGRIKNTGIFWDFSQNKITFPEKLNCINRDLQFEAPTWKSDQPACTILIMHLSILKMLKMYEVAECHLCSIKFLISVTCQMHLASTLSFTSWGLENLSINRIMSIYTVMSIGGRVKKLRNYVFHNEFKLLSHICLEVEFIVPINYI